jgi:hypothetical protein
VREIIELSSAVKYLNIDTYLCTYKIFKYYLTIPEILRRSVKIFCEKFLCQRFI